MKRLTISMSDELFDRLNDIENKSLFVRSLIEQALDLRSGEAGTAPWSEDMDDIRGELSGLTSRLQGIENQIDSIQSILQVTPPEPKPLEEAAPEPAVVMPELKPPEEAAPEPAVVMPELKPPEEAAPEPSFVMPELKPPEEAAPEPAVVMPELKPPEEIPPQPPFAMPEKVPPKSSIPPLTPAPIPTAAFEPPLPATAPTPPPEKPTASPDKLEGNILMYMPHGAELKREIIMSLLSKRYDANETEAKINQMVAAGTLSAITKEGKDYLIRP